MKSNKQETVYEAYGLNKDQADKILHEVLEIFVSSGTRKEDLDKLLPSASAKTKVAIFVYASLLHIEFTLHDQKCDHKHD